MKHTIEVFSAGCKVCTDAIATVKQFTRSDDQVIVHDMQKAEVAERAALHGVHSVPSILIDGKLATCCATRGLDENVLRDALL